MTRARLGALACVSALLLAGCGSTVQVSGSSTTGTDGIDQGLGVPESLSPTTTSSDPSAAAGTPGSTPLAPGTVTAPGTRGGSSAAPTSVLPSTGTGSAAVPGTSGRGFTATTLTVGYVEITGTDAAANTFGISGASVGDVNAQYNAVRNYINARGGVAGRKLELVKYSVDLASALANPDQAAAAVCAAFTQDRKVFAVLQPLPTSNQRDCLAKASTPMIEADSYHIGQPEYDKYPDLLFGAGRITSDRLLSLLVTSLAERTFFTGWNTVTGGPGNAPVKLGLLHADNPEANYDAALQVRLLKAIGLEVKDTVVYASNVQAGLAATQSAILKFKADGITHVLGASAFFLQGAENQNYRPRYVLPPGIGQLYADNSPAAQMVGSMTVGWQPASDVEEAQDPGDVSPAQTLCESLMKKSGQPITNRPTLASMLAVCDVTFFLRDALTGLSGLSNSLLRQGAERLGTWQSAQTFVSRFGPGKHASADAVRDQAYDAGCSCVVYASKRNRT